MAGGGFRVKAVFDVVVRKLADIDKLNSKMKKLQDQSNRSRNVMGQFAKESSRTNAAMGSMGSNIRSAIGYFATLATAIGGARAAMGLWNASVGAAMKNEMNENALKVTLGSDAKAQDMMDFTKNEQLGSVYSLQDWRAGAKGLAPILKDDMNLMKKTLQNAEALAMSDPTRGFDDAIFSIREALSSDYISLQERFSIPRSVIKDFKAIADEKGLKGVAKDAFVVEEAMKKMGFGQAFVNSQMDTALGQWTMFKNRVKSTLMMAGEQSLKHLQPLFEGLNNWLSGDNIDKLADSIGSKIAYLISGFIELGKDMHKFFNSEGFNKFIDDTMKTLDPLIDRIKEWGEVLKTVGQYINDDVVPALKNLNEQLGNDNTALGKAWDFAAPILMTMGALKIVGKVGKKLGLDKVFRATGKAAAFVFGGSMLGKIGKFAKSLSRVGRVLGPKGALAWLARVGFRSLSKLFVGGGPIGIIIALLIELGFWLYDNKDKVKNWMEEIGKSLEGVKKFFTDTWQAIRDFVMPIWLEVSNFVKDEWAKVKTALMGDNSEIKSNFEIIWTGISQQLTETWGTITQLISGSTAQISMILSMAWETIKLGFSLTWFHVSNIVKTAWDNIKLYVSDGVDAILATVALFGEVLTGDWSGAWESVKLLAMAVWSAMSIGWDDFILGMLSATIGGLDGITEKFGTWGTNMKTSFNTFVSDIKAIFGGGWQSILGLITAPFSGASGIIGGILNGILSKINAVKNGMSGVGSGSVRGGNQSVDGSNRFGLANVPFNGYVSELHKGERVLTAKENKKYTTQQYQGTSKGGISIGSLANTLIVREDADIDKIAKALAIELVAAMGAGA